MGTTGHGHPDRRRNAPGNRQDFCEFIVLQRAADSSQADNRLCLCPPACEMLQAVKLSNTPFSSSHFKLPLLYKIISPSKTWLFGLKAFRRTCEENNEADGQDVLWLCLVLRGVWVRAVNRKES